MQFGIDLLLEIWPKNYHVIAAWSRVIIATESRNKSILYFESHHVIMQVVFHTKSGPNTFNSLNNWKTLIEQSKVFKANNWSSAVNLLVWWTAASIHYLSHRNCILVIWLNEKFNHHQVFPIGFHSEFHKTNYTIY